MYVFVSPARAVYRYVLVLPCWATSPCWETQTPQRSVIPHCGPPCATALPAAPSTGGVLSLLRAPTAMRHMAWFLALCLYMCARARGWLTACQVIINRARFRFRAAWLGSRGDQSPGVHPHIARHGGVRRLKRLVAGTRVHALDVAPGAPAIQKKSLSMAMSHSIWSAIAMKSARRPPRLKMFHVGP